MPDTVYLKMGSNWRTMNRDDLNLHDNLPVGTYTVKFNSLEGYYFLTTVDDFTIGNKIYGNAEERANRILNTFHSRPNSTGVLLSGDKGSGKTQLAKLIAAKAAKDGVLTILINEPHSGEKFNQFIQEIKQPSVVLFDEFEKVYNEDRGLQDAILTILDGVYPSKKLFIATINGQHRISEFMLNRPGRFFYKYSYGRLEQDIIIEYCNEQLNDKKYLDKIVSFSSMTQVFSFDILKAIVEELNRYGGEFAETVEALNISVDLWGRSYDITKIEYKDTGSKERRIPVNSIHDHTLSGGRPVTVTDNVYIGYTYKSPDGEEDYDHFYLNFGDAKSYDAKSGVVVYETDEVIIHAAPRKHEAGYNIYSAL